MAYAQALELKGIRLGMSQFDLQDLHGQLPLQGLTIAGITSKYPINPDFLDGRLEQFEFFFDSSEFNRMLVAVQKKYPTLKCTNSRVATVAGVRLIQTECALNGKDGTLSLNRFVSDVSTSVLTMTSREVIERRRKTMKAGDKDI